MYETAARPENPFKNLRIHITVQSGDLNPCTYGALSSGSWGAPDCSSDDFESIEDLFDSLEYMPGAVLFEILPGTVLDHERSRR